MVDARPLAGIAEIAEHLGIPPSTIYDQRYRGTGVGALAIKVGKHLRWRWKDIDAWLDQQASQSAGGAA
ncbi:helix-turn-helix domain-containing protein [Amycolatopsis cynarae]|uniref:Helix-turn-helix domain-containing protein n=1 Tax=Amycolatopsis cynarae TaxID=2995223 RepID=A0ABY7AWT0_9PSEU|nr:helix-turn-helix domain-containing protein [Amycolatopsis sp. HUAS 11-8]WAL64465.1 helix-turn-helix domain-containing protein [Amycolatopsis sp. HUAS 11-8]